MPAEPPSPTAFLQPRGVERVSMHAIPDPVNPDASIVTVQLIGEDHKPVLAPVLVCLWVNTDGGPAPAHPKWATVTPSSEAIAERKKVDMTWDEKVCGGVYVVVGEVQLAVTCDPTELDTNFRPTNLPVLYIWAGPAGHTPDLYILTADKFSETPPEPPK